MSQVGPIDHLGLAHILKESDIGAGGEIALQGTAKDDHADNRVGLILAHGGVDLLHHVPVLGVHGGGRLKSTQPTRFFTCNDMSLYSVI